MFGCWKKGEKTSVVEGVCDEGEKCYPEDSLPNKCCFVLVHHFMDDAGGGVNPNEMHKFIPGKRYRITVEQLD